MRKKAYRPTKEEQKRAFVAISKLCESMAEMPVCQLHTKKKEIEELAKEFPGSEFLELEPAEMVRRVKMGKEAARLLIVPEFKYKKTEKTEEDVEEE